MADATREARLLFISWRHSGKAIHSDISFNVMKKWIERDNQSVENIHLMERLITQGAVSEMIVGEWNLIKSV